jgi:hypothetical protein
MTLRTLLGPHIRLAAAALTIAAAVTLSLSAQTPPAPAAPGPLVAATVLEPLLPSPDGWTRTKASSDRVTVSASCLYSFAGATYTKDAMTVRVTVADTGSNEEALGLLATMVVSLPENYVGEVPPATTVARLTVGGQPAASRWDDKAKEGEFTVVVGGRFVAMAEGRHMTDPATLRAIVELVDLKKLRELR